MYICQVIKIHIMETINSSSGKTLDKVGNFIKSIFKKQ